MYLGSNFTRDGIYDSGIEQRVNCTKLYIYEAYEKSERVKKWTKHQVSWNCEPVVSYILVNAKRNNWLCKKRVSSLAYVW